MLGTWSCWKSPNLNHFHIKHIASLKEAIIEDFVERAINNVEGRKGCWRKLRDEMDLLKEDVARDKVDVPKLKRRLCQRI